MVTKRPDGALNDAERELKGLAGGRRGRRPGRRRRGVTV